LNYTRAGASFYCAARPLCSGCDVPQKGEEKD